jgi:hypothetical protein
MESGRFRGVTRLLSLIVVDENRDTDGGTHLPFFVEDPRKDLQQQVGCDLPYPSLGMPPATAN